MLELTIEENIKIFCLLPHTTHALQPFDQPVFGPFNTAYDTACSEFFSQSPYHVVNIQNFPRLFKKAWEADVSNDNIRNGFRACGIIPFHPDALSSEVYDPSSATETPTLSATASKPPVVTETETSVHTSSEQLSPTFHSNNPVMISTRMKQRPVRKSLHVMKHKLVRSP